MLMRADILLLDEPTNHLDVANVAWLENYLVNRPEISSVGALFLGLVFFLAGKLPGQPPRNLLGGCVGSVCTRLVLCTRVAWLGE